MGPSDAELSANIQQWLAAWAHWLELWLASGADAPGPTATSALKDWRQTIPEAGFGEVRQYVDQLLSQDASRAARSDALLALLVWQHTASRLLQARQISPRTTS